jgi:hypothetical protein
MCTTTDVVRMIRWAVHVARIIETCMLVLVGKPEGSVRLENQDGGEMMILKWIVNKMGKGDLDSPNSG